MFKVGFSQGCSWSFMLESGIFLFKTDCNLSFWMPGNDSATLSLCFNLKNKGSTSQNAFPIAVNNHSPWLYGKNWSLGHKTSLTLNPSKLQMMSQNPGIVPTFVLCLFPLEMHSDIIICTCVYSVIYFHPLY